MVLPNLFQLTSTFTLYVHCILQVSSFGEKKLKVSGVLENKMKVGGILDFTGGFGLKIRQVSAGFGCGEGYYVANIL